MTTSRTRAAIAIAISALDGCHPADCPGGGVLRLIFRMVSVSTSAAWMVCRNGARAPMMDTCLPTFDVG